MPANINIKVSIPVTVGGYTGQREEWEEYERDYEATTDGGKVILTSRARRQSGQVKFDLKDLEAALRALDLTTPAMRGAALAEARP